ncbi:hypothetical protein VTI74DRAFT_2767 [Chaetomium olivicolor]
MIRASHDPGRWDRVHRKTVPFLYWVVIPNSVSFGLQRLWKQRRRYCDVGPAEHQKAWAVNVNHKSRCMPCQVCRRRNNYVTGSWHAVAGISRYMPPYPSRTGEGGSGRSIPLQHLGVMALRSWGRNSGKTVDLILFRRPRSIGVDIDLQLWWRMNDASLHHYRHRRRTAHATASFVPCFRRPHPS